MGLNVTVQIVSASNLGGIYPFVVVCFDNDVQSEVHKTAATNGGMLAVWNETFSMDLATHIKRITDEGKPEPTYLTFFMYDTGSEKIPSLGSAGVLLSTVRDNGVAKGDFPVVNGTGTLSLVVEADNSDKWYKSNTAKAVGAVGAVGALAAGITAMAVHHKKKKAAGPNDEPTDPSGKKKKSKFTMPGFGRNSHEEEEEDPNSHQYRAGEGEHDAEDAAVAHDGHPSRSGGGVAATNTSAREFNGGGASSSQRPWWDPDTDDEDEHDDHDDDGHGATPGRQGGGQQPMPQSYAPTSYDPAQTQQPHYEGSVAGRGVGAGAGNDAPGHGQNQYDDDVGAPGGHVGPNDASGVPEFPQHTRARDEPGEYGGTSYVEDDDHLPSDYDESLDA